MTVDIRLDIAQLDHQACVRALLPRLVEHCAAKAQPNELDRFLARLGPDAANAACALLDDMSVDARDRMIVWLVSAHEERMRNSANRRLGALLGDNVVRIGRFCAVDRPGSRLMMQASDVAVDWQALLKSPVVGEGIDRLGGENSILKGAAKLVIQMGSHLSGESLERQGISLFNTERVKRRLTDVLQDALRQEGLDVTIEALTVERSGAAPLPVQATADEGMIPDAFEDELLDALAKQVRKLRG